MKKKFTMLLMALFAFVGVAKAQYYVIESIGDNITDLSALEEDSYVALFNVGRNKFIYEGTFDYKMYMGAEAPVGAGHEYIWQVHKEGENFLFSSLCGKYISTPLDGQDVYTVASDNEAKDKFTITAHGEDATKWKLQSMNNTNIYWDAQDGRFVGWKGNGANSQYEIRPVTVSESTSDLAKLITVDENNIKWLAIKNVRRQKYATYAGDEATMTQQTNLTIASLFYFTGRATADAANVRIHNYAAGNLLCAEYNSWTSEGREWLIKKQETGLSIAYPNDADNAWNDYQGGGETLNYWGSADAGSAWQVELVSDFTFVVDIDDLKEDAIGELTELAKLSFIYSTAEQAKAEINNLNPAKNNLKELEDAAEQIKAIVAKCKTDAYQALNEKYFTIYTPARQNGYMQMTVSKVVGTASVSGPANIWQFIYNDNGAYYIYNPYIGQYLCEPNENSQIVSVTNDQSNASAYTFVISTTDNDKDGAVVKLTSNDKSVHMDGSSNLVRWDDGAASEWSIVDITSEMSTFVGAYKDLVLKNLENLSTLLGMDVNTTKDAIETMNTTDYATFAAIDVSFADFADAIATKDVVLKNSNTTDANRSNVYLATDMNDEKGRGNKEFDYNAVWKLHHASGAAFYLYNNLHKVYLGNPGGGGALTSDPAASYTFEVVDASTKLVELKSGGQTLHVHNWEDCTLTNHDGDESASRWYVSTTEIQALVDANIGNYAEVPQLGQYTKDAYDALVAAKDNAKTVEDANDAMTVFKSSINSPVYIISGTYDYADGKAIYYNGSNPEWRWDTKDVYNRAMWFKIPGLTTSEFAFNTEYKVIDVLNGLNICGRESIKFQTIENWDGVYNLQFGSADHEYIHAGNYSNNIVTYWYPATTESNQASAWKVEYIGNTYELSKLTDDYLAALKDLKDAYNAKLHYKNYNFGDGVGQYQGEVLEALNAADFLLSKDLSSQASFELEDIKRLTDRIENLQIILNMPEDGKYYRIKGANDNASLKGYYVTGNTNWDGGRIALTAEADASTIYYYADGKLQAYQSGKYIGLNSGHYVFATSKDDETHPASAIEFAASSYVAGAYTIKSDDRYLHYKVYNGAVEIDRCSEEESANDSWYLEEVQKERITYIYKSGDKEAARKVVEEFAGMPYPQPEVVSPFGFTVADGVYGGNVSKGETLKEIACTLNLPFEYADSYENIGNKWYFLKFHANNNNYLYYDKDGEVLDATKTQIDRADIKAYAWAFVGDPINGFRLVNKKANDNADVVKGVKATSAGAVVAEGGDVLKLTASTYGTNGFFMEAPSGDKTQRFNKQGGKVVYWSDADAGSTFMVSAVSELATLIAEAEKLKTTVDGNKGNKIGEYSEETASILATAIENAQTKGDAATAADVEALQAVLDATKVIYPEVGKYYQFHSAMGFAETKAVYSYKGEPCWKTLDNDDKSFCWKAVATADGGIAFQNAIDRKYLNGNANQSGAWTVSDTPENIGLKILSKEESAKGYQYGIVLNDWQMHANWHGGGSGTGSNIVSWNTNANDASAWYIVQTELYDIVYVFKCDDVTIDKYSQFAVLEEGAAYPAVQVPALPYGVSTNAATPEGNVTESKTFEFTLTVDKALPFKAVAEGTPENWYYVQMHAFPDYGFYISANSNKLVWYGANEEAAKYVDTNASLNDYLWGFVGNMWDGFKMVNKAGKAVNSSGSGDVAVGHLNVATAFMAWNSQANGDWFCLKHPEKEQYLNLNVENSTIQHWDANDNGSSLLVTEYKEYPLSVSAAGYSTYYSDDRLSIPAEVEAYVVSEIDITDGSGSVSLQQVEGVLPAHTGVILKNEGNYTFVTSAAKPADIAANYLKGTTTNTLITPEDGTVCYVLAKGKQGIGLYKASLNMTAEGQDVGKGNGTAFLNNANKVYLPVPVSGQQGAPSLTFRFGTSEVESMDVVATDEVIIYDLMGRRVVKMDKGIYIVNGKKVLVK